MGGVVSFFCGCLGHQTHDPKGTKLVSERGCTDKIIFILYIIGWVISILVITRASDLGGNPDKIINGINFQGQICGVSPEVRHQSKAALVNPLTTDYDTFRVWTCVESCEATKNPTSPNFATLYGSTDFFGYCIPTFDLDNSSLSIDLNMKSQFDDTFDAYAAEVSRAVSDLANAWEVILMSACFALFFSYVYIFLAKRFAGVIIWLCILLVIIGGFLLGYAFLHEASEASSETSENRILAYRVGGYIFIGATSLFVLIILGLSSQISLAVEVVKEGSRAINDMKLIVFFPLIPMFLCCGYFVYFIYGALYIFSVSDLESESMPSNVLTRESPTLLAPYTTWRHYGAPELEGTPIEENRAYNLSTYQLKENYRPLAAYHVFHMLWQVQFLVYFGYFVIAGAVCGWYFTLTDANGNKIVGGANGGSRTPILASVWRAIRYHIGTIAFAALIIAIVRFIRAVVIYIELKTRTKPPSYLQKAIFCLIQCCLKCVECCLNKISKNALVWSAMWGDPFLSASCSSFALIWRNLSRVAAVHVVSDVILLIGKVAIAAMTVGLSAMILNNVEPWKNTVSSAFVPCILICILAYFVAWLFFLTFETVIDTTFLENVSKNPGEAMFASKGLQQLVGKYQLRSAMLAEDMKKSNAELHEHMNGGKTSAKVAHDEHEMAIVQLDRAIMAKKGTNTHTNTAAPAPARAAPAPVPVPSPARGGNPAANRVTRVEDISHKSAWS